MVLVLQLYGLQLGNTFLNVPPRNQEDFILDFSGASTKAAKYFQVL